MGLQRQGSVTGYLLRIGLTGIMQRREGYVLRDSAFCLQVNTTVKGLHGRKADWLTIDRNTVMPSSRIGWTRFRGVAHAERRGPPPYLRATLDWTAVAALTGMRSASKSQGDWHHGGQLNISVRPSPSI